MHPGIYRTNRDLFPPCLYSAGKIVNLLKSFTGQHLRSNPTAPADSSVNDNRFFTGKFAETAIQVA
jgi:hypothetical protein